MGLLRTTLPWYIRLADYFNPPNEYEFIDNQHLYVYHLHTLRPWDKRPSPLYYEAREDRKRRRGVQTTSLTSLLGVLASLLFISWIVAILPIAGNWETLAQTYKDLKKPTSLYDNGGVLVALWLFAHTFNAFAGWFVVMSPGGLGNNRFPTLTYFAGTFLETLWLDMLFKTGRWDWVQAVLVLMLVAFAITAIRLLFTVPIAGAFLVPFIAIVSYMIVVVDGFIGIYGKYVALDNLQ